jgi:mRNA interferase MazF
MRQGEIWQIDLDPTKGSEMRKTRPAVIVNDDTLGKLPLKVVVPLTDWKDRYFSVPWMVQVRPSRTNGLSKDSAADCFQVRSISEERFVRKLGRLTARESKDIRSALAKVLSIGF